MLRTPYTRVFLLMVTTIPRTHGSISFPMLLAECLGTVWCGSLGTCLDTPSFYGWPYITDFQLMIEYTYSLEGHWHVFFVTATWKTILTFFFNALIRTSFGRNYWGDVTSSAAITLGKILWQMQQLVGKGRRPEALYPSCVYQLLSTICGGKEMIGALGTRINLKKCFLGTF